MRYLPVCCALRRGFAPVPYQRPPSARESCSCRKAQTRQPFWQRHRTPKCPIQNPHHPPNQHNGNHWQCRLSPARTDHHHKPEKVRMHPPRYRAGAQPTPPQHCPAPLAKPPTRPSTWPPAPRKRPLQPQGSGRQPSTPTLAGRAANQPTVRRRCHSRRRSEL